MSALTYVRVDPTRPLCEVVRRFEPLKSEHPLVGNAPCPVCQLPFCAGEFTCIVPLGPGESEEERGKARARRCYNAVGIIAHFACVTGIADGEIAPAPGYTISTDRTSIRCHTCGLTSYNPHDVENRYCEMCHRFHGEGA